MTHTIELDASEERVLERKAQRRGVALDVYLREVVRREAQTESDAATRREEAIKAARGSMAQLSGSVNAFMSERSANDAFASDAQ